MASAQRCTSPSTARDTHGATLTPPKPCRLLHCTSLFCGRCAPASTFIAVTAVGDMASSSSFSAEDASDTSSASGASSVFDSETTDSEEERWKAEEEAREAAAARAVAYELQRAEVAAARNLRRAAPTVESSGEGSSQDSAPHVAADSISDSSDLSVAQEGGETQPEAPAGDAKQSSSPEVSGDVALPASTQATIRRTVLSNVDYWACVRLIQAMGHTLRLPPMSLAVRTRSQAGRDVPLRTPRAPPSAEFGGSPRAPQQTQRHVASDGAAPGAGRRGPPHVDVRTASPHRHIATLHQKAFLLHAALPRTPLTPTHPRSAAVAGIPRGTHHWCAF